MRVIHVLEYKIMRMLVWNYKSYDFVGPEHGSESVRTGLEWKSLGVFDREGAFLWDPNMVRIRPEPVWNGNSFDFLHLRVPTPFAVLKF